MIAIRVNCQLPAAFGVGEHNHPAQDGGPSGEIGLVDG